MPVIAKDESFDLYRVRVWNQGKVRSWRAAEGS
jgi:hypothetical protein